MNLIFGVKNALEKDENVEYLAMINMGEEVIVAVTNKKDILIKKGCLSKTKGSRKCLIQP